MSRHHPLTHGLALLLSIALTACGSAPQPPHLVTPDHEVAALQQQVAELTRQLRKSRSVSDRLTHSQVPITDSPPPLSGTVTEVSDLQFGIRVDDNQDAVDLGMLVSRSLFHIGIHDQNGFKTDAVTIGFDAATSRLLCMATSVVAPIEGDGAMTASYHKARPSNAGSSRDCEIAALQQQVTDLTLERELEEARLSALTCGCWFAPFPPSPPLALVGTVTEIVGRDCTIRIDDNPDAVDIAAQIERRPFRIALYSTDGYKAEAVSTRYDAATASLFCKVMFVKDGTTLVTGDRATTK